MHPSVAAAEFILIVIFAAVIVCCITSGMRPSVLNRSVITSVCLHCVLFYLYRQEGEGCLYPPFRWREGMTLSSECSTLFR